MVTLRTTTLLILLISVLGLNAQTTISGLASGTWEAEGNPYIIEGNVFVGPDERLSIKPGVEIYFTGSFQFMIIGRFDAMGTEESPIVFTLEDTTGFANGDSGWKGLNFSGGGSSSEYSTINHCIIEYSNTNGISCTDFSLLQLSNSLIRHNNGFGLAIHQFSNILVDGVELTHNQSGGIDAEFSIPQISNFTIKNNNGPGVRLFGMLNGGTPVSLTNGEISNNLSATNGGGLYATNVSVELENVRIQSNTAYYGGGLYLGYGSDVAMDQTLIAGNYAQEDGGAIYLTEAMLDVVQSTISDNEAGNQAGGIYYDVIGSEVATMNSSILWGNYPEEIVVTVQKPFITWSNVGVQYYGIGNINEDPMFVNAESGNYQLGWADYPVQNASMSPCIDAGDPALPADPDGTEADMGALGYFQSTITQVETHQNTQFGLYPNPANNVINISSTQDLSDVRILNLSGNVVKSFSAASVNSSMDVGDLTAGIYIVQVAWKDGSVSSQKMIKE